MTITHEEFENALGTLCKENGSQTIGDLIDIIVCEREELEPESALRAAAAMDWDKAWTGIVGPAIDRLADLLVEHGADRDEDWRTA